MRAGGLAHARLRVIQKHRPVLGRQTILFASQTIYFARELANKRRSARLKEDDKHCCIVNRNDLCTDVRLHDGLLLKSFLCMYDMMKDF